MDRDGEFIRGAPTVPTAVAVDYVAGILAVRLEENPAYSFADAAVINDRLGWDFNLPDETGHVTHWSPVQLTPEALAQAWALEQELGALRAPQPAP